MPMFEYKCPSCGSNFEKLLPHAKADDVECVACSAKAERQLSRFGVAAAQSQAPTMSPCAQGRSDMSGCHGGMCGLN